MIVLFSHQKGGVGKSTIAINYCYSVKNQYKDVVILDLDSQHSSKLFNELRKSEMMSTVECLTVEEINIENLFEKYSADKNNLLVVDSGGYDSDINRIALINADLIVTPVSISQIELFGLQKYRDMLEVASEATGTRFKTNVLLNNIDSRSKGRLEELKEYIKTNKESFSLLNTVVHSRADFRNSYGDGKTVEEFNKSGVAAKEIKALSKEINKLIKNYKIL